ncbi:hypothetical protein PYCCODRAFT_1098443 [Trametes coccinea BRFM310]|uniref:Uncharacterized protein n=1 Tax=Trametes coccinea (strain BRFM310) TaxID=1353009 RepID=A0A1Y2I9S8_TRAC3|nr:hypothetical protein PYCCODRAFT_1098443 [Trametes coccinea BRFM310]
MPCRCLIAEKSFRSISATGRWRWYRGTDGVSSALNRVSCLLQYVGDRFRLAHDTFGGMKTCVAFWETTPGPYSSGFTGCSLVRLVSPDDCEHLAIRRPTTTGVIVR